MVKTKILSSLLFLFLCLPEQGISWGFQAHQRITKMAIYLLPPEMFPFYKDHAQQLMDDCLAPDKRRHLVENETPRHFIDLEAYGDSAWVRMPREWDSACAQYGKDSLLAYGIVPYHIGLMQYQLTQAFKEKDQERILHYSAEISHYIADANVPLHTTVNYDGQLTGQKGIHRLWETVLTQRYMDSYDYTLPPASYVYHRDSSIWNHITEAHHRVAVLLKAEQELSASWPAEQKYSYREVAGQIKKTYSPAYVAAYHQSLNGMVEEQLRASIRQLADFYFTAWVDAGQPEL